MREIAPYIRHRFRARIVFDLKKMMSPPSGKENGNQLPSISGENIK